MEMSLIRVLSFLGQNIETELPECSPGAQAMG